MYFILRKKFFLVPSAEKAITNLVAISTSGSQTIVSKYYFIQKKGKKVRKKGGE